MPRCYCFLCASDEGVFLEVTPESVRVAFGGQIEACLSKQVNQTIELSNKICYKCAYELDQCSKFLQKSKRSQDTGRFPRNKTVPHCSLCYDLVESGHIFDITEDNRSVFSPLQKIRKIFNDELYGKVSQSRLVCLVCRYNLDVLYDLKKLHEQTVNHLEDLINKELDYSSFPKVYTDVVNRKTTITTFPDTTIYGLISSDSESNDDMARRKSHGRLRGKSRGKLPINKRSIKKSQSDAKSKSRCCDQCNSVVANDMDMYRFYHTGQTVCRNCWITTDPNKSKSKRNSYTSLAETKLCTVYLKDVLNEESHDNNVCKEEEDKDDYKDDNKIGIISDQSSQDEDKSLRMSLRKKRKPTMNGNAGSKKRTNSTKSDVDSVLSKRMKVSVTVHKTRSSKALSDLDQPSTSFQKKQGHKRKNMSDWSSDSDYSQETSIAKSRTRRNMRARINDLIQIISSASEEDDTNRRVTKRQKTVTAGVTRSVHSESNDESSNETGGKKRKTTAALSSTRSRTRSSSISSKETTPPREFKSPKAVVLQEYTCDKCSMKFNTKLAQAEHKLTHDKQLTLKLERVTVPEKEEEEKVDSQEDKTISEEPEAGISGITSIGKDSTDLSEEIGINVDDDDDDEETLKKDKEDDKNDQKEKPDAKKSESHQEDESSNIQMDEEAVASESQECAESTAVDETAAETNNTEEDTALMDKVNASEDQDDHAQEDNAVVKNHKMSDAEKEDEDATMEDDTEKTSAAEREEEHDKELEDKITHDDENTESPVSPTIKDNKDNTVEHDEDYNEDIESNLENNPRDDEDERAKDAEARLSTDLTNDFQEEDPEKSEEKRSTPDITEMETLDDKESSMIEYLKKQPNAVDKQNAQSEEVTDADKYDDSTGNITKPDLLNCETMNELGDENAEEENHDDDVAVDVTDSNDMLAVKSKKTTEETTEETIMTNDSLKEKTTPTEDADDFEQVMENNAELQECDLQEKSKKREVCENSHISTDTATKIMEEVFDLAAAEVQKRRNSNGVKINSDEDIEMETLENISREIHNTADMPSLDVDGVINDVTTTE